MRLSLLASSLIVLGLAACGGLAYDSLDASEWLPDFHGEHGAIAFNAERFSAALTASHLTQDEANAAALQLCGDGCEIILQFEGQGACGSIAAGSNRVIGVGSGSPRDVADSAALAQCSDAGGEACIVKLHACNE